MMLKWMGIARKMQVVSRLMTPALPRSLATRSTTMLDLAIASVVFTCNLTLFWSPYYKGPFINDVSRERGREGVTQNLTH